MLLLFRLTCVVVCLASVSALGQPEPGVAKTAPAQAPSATPIPVPTNDEAIALAREAVEAELQRLGPAASQPTTVPAGVAGEILEAQAALRKVLEDSRTALDSYQKQLAAIAQLASEPAQAELDDEVSRTKHRTAELEALLAKGRADAAPAKAEAIEREYEQANAQTDALSSAQVRREQTLQEHDAQRRALQEQAAQAIEALSSFRKTPTTLPIEGDAEAAARLHALREGARVWSVALVNLRVQALATAKTLTALERDRAETLLPALHEYVRALGTWRTRLREAQTRTATQRIQDELAQANTEHERLYWQARLRIETAKREFTDKLDPIRERYRESTKNALSRALNRSQRSWKRFADSAARYDGHEKLRRFRELAREKKRYEVELAELQALLAESERDHAGILATWDRTETALDRLHAELVATVEAFTDAEERKAAARLAPELTKTYRPALDAAFEEIEGQATGLGSRLTESSKETANHLAFLTEVQDELYWAYVLARDVGWFDADWSTLRVQLRQLLAMFGHDGVEGEYATTLRSARTVLATHVRQAPRTELAISLLAAALCGGLALAQRRKIRAWAKAQADRATEMMKEQQLALAPLPERLQMRAARVGGHMAVWAMPLLALLVALHLADVRRDVAFQLIREALIFVLMAGLAAGLLRFFFGARKARYRLTPCANNVAAYYLRWGRIALWISIVALPVPLLLIATDTCPLLRRYWLGLYKGMMFAALLLFLRHRRTVVRVVGRVQNLRYQRLYRALVALYPLFFIAVLGLFVLQVLGYSELTTYVVGNASQTLVAIVLASLINRLIRDLVERYRSAAEEEAAEAVDKDAADVGTIEFESMLTPVTMVAWLAELARWGVGIAAVVWIGWAWGLTAYRLDVWMDYGWALSGGRKVTVWRIAAAIALVMGSSYLSRTIRDALQKRVYRDHFPLDRGAQAAISSLLHYTLVFTGVYLALNTLHVSLGALALLLGGLGLGLGLGLQPLVVNFVSGLLIFIERHIKVGDVIEVHGKLGEVTRISMRSTAIKTFDNIDIVIPNGEFITNAVVNWTLHDRLIRGKVNIGVAYGSNTTLVRDQLLNAAKENPRVLPEPAPDVWFTEFADNSLNFTLVAWFANTSDRWTGMIELRYAIDRLFREHNIEIPFPQRTLTFKSDSPMPIQPTSEGTQPPPATKVPPPAPPEASQQVDLEGIDEH